MPTTKPIGYSPAGIAAHADLDQLWTNAANAAAAAAAAAAAVAAVTQVSFVTVGGFTQADITAGIAAATAAKLGLFFPPGTYLCTATAVLNAEIPRIFGCGRSTILQAQGGFAGSALFQVGANEGGAAKKHLFLDHLMFDVTPVAQTVDGVVVYKAEELTLGDLFVQAARNGVFFDGQYNVRILNSRLRNCYTTGCLVGYKLDGPNPQTTSYDTFLLESCASESDATGLWARGKMQNRITLVGCELQNSSVAGIHADGVTVALRGTYIETSAPTTVPALQLVNGAVVEQDATSVATYPSIDATSRLLPAPGALVAGYRYSAPQIVGASDALTGAVQLWGPPNFPVDGRAGYTAYVGQIYTDPQGVRWVCRLGGNSLGVPTYPRWDALDGEIRIPMDLTTLGNGTKLWWPQNDFVLQSVEFVPTTTAGGGTWIEIGTDNVNTPQSLLSQTQCAVANLVAGKIVAARDNLHATAQLSGVGLRIVLVGVDHNAVPTGGNYIGYLKSGVFNAGAGVLIIKGYYPRGGARGTLALVPPSAGIGTREILGGWSQMGTVDINQAGVRLLDSFQEAGGGVPYGRLMLRGGAVTAIGAFLSATKTAGACTILASYSQDNGATFANFTGSLVIPNSVVPNVAVFPPSQNIFPAGCLLIVRVVTDGAFAPTVNDLLVTLEVTQ